MSSGSMTITLKQFATKLIAERSKVFAVAKEIFRFAPDAKLFVERAFGVCA